MRHIAIPDEVWKPVVGNEDRYEVSNFGRVRSLDRVQVIGGPKPHRRQYRGRILQLLDSGIGYPVISVWHPKRQLLYVHIMVLEAFVGPRPHKAEGRHLDDVRSNNHLSNLAWGSQGDNYRDALNNGRRTKKVAHNILRFQQGREAAIRGNKRDGRKGADWLEGYDQVANEGARK